ncbi:MAG: aryl-sulfate sulfotransferase [Pseudomonadota bacterium]
MNRLLLLLLPLLLTNCSTPGSSTSPGDTAEDRGVGDTLADSDRHDAAPDTLPRVETLEEVAISGLVVIQNPANVLSFYVEWETDALATTELHVECGDGDTIDLTDDLLRSKHRAFVMGFWEGANCQVVARSTDAAGSVGQLVAPLEVGALPDFLPALDLQVRKPNKMQGGWTLFNLTNDFDEPPLLVVMVDDQGRYRWYHQRATNDPGSDTDTRTVPGGVLIGGTHGKVKPAFVDWEGSVLWDKWMNVHHDFRPIGDEGHWLMLTDNEGCGQIPHGGIVFEYDRFTDSKVWEWYACAHIAPEEPWQDWSHLNSVSLWPDGEHLLISSRNLNGIFKVEYPSGEVVWELNGGGGDFAWEDGDDRFWGQHDPEVQPDSTHILLYDNGLEGEREWSRVLELEIDEDAKTVKKVWEYRPDPDIFTPIWGDADRQPNGNTLITFGARSKKEHTQLVEVTPDKEQVWRLVPPLKWGVYRSERVVNPVRGYLRSD